MITKSGLTGIFFAMLCFVFHGTDAFASKKTISVAVRVVETSETAVDAKELAFKSGLTKALDRITLAYTAKFQRKKLPETSFSPASKALHSFSVQSEKLGAKSYSAIYYVHFDRKRLAQYFQRYGVRLLDRKSPNILILPIFIDSEDKYIFLKRRDTLYKALEKRTKNSLLNVKLPSQSVSDRLLSPADILSFEKYTIRELKYRYGVNYLVASLIALDEDGAPKEITLSGQDPLGKIQHQIPVSLQGRRISTGIWDQFVSELVESLEDRWKTAYANRSGAFSGTGARDVTLGADNEYHDPGIDEIQTGSISPESEPHLEYEPTDIDNEINKWIEEAEKEIGEQDYLPLNDF